MVFQVDNQTLEDLDIVSFGKKRTNVFDLFDHVRSLKGKERLQFFLKHPLTDYDMINGRLNVIRFFQNLTCKSELDIDKNTLDFIEYYLAQGDYPTRPPSKYGVFENALIRKITSTSNEYYIIERGIDYVLFLLNNLHAFCKKMSTFACPQLIAENNAFVFALFESPEFRHVSTVKEMEKLKPFDIATYDYLFRYTHKEVIRRALNIFYDYDVFMAVSEVVAEKNFCYPDVLPAETSVFEMKEVYSPFIANPVKNDLSFSSACNLAFITGPNMAGKSSLLKAVALTAYLAHVGFPVPATHCRISLLSGIFTTINLSDDLGLGYSHFYAEVARIKYIAEKLNENSNMLIIFDELFRGTNIKDAYDGSVAIISAFSKIRNCFFAISTHIVEVVEHIQSAKWSGIQFQQMDITVEEGDVRYTYRLKEGISDKRLGMYIIEKEKVLDIINAIPVS